MNLELLSDPLFLWPCLTGLVFALLLPLCGAYLRLRGEWLAALSYAQMAAAGSLSAAALALPLVLGGPAAAFLAAAVKNAFEEAAEATRGAAYAMLLLAGWGTAVLLAANLPLAERLGHALFDGQLYFTDRSHFLAALGAFAVAVPLLRWLSRPLLLSHFYPDFYRARGRSSRRLHLVFDLVVAGVLALATTSVGVMAAFALVFIPPWPPPPGPAAGVPPCGWAPSWAAWPTCWPSPWPWSWISPSAQCWPCCWFSWGPPAPCWRAVFPGLRHDGVV